MKTANRDTAPLGEAGWKALLAEIDALTPLEVADTFAALFTLYPTTQAAFVLKSMAEFDRASTREIVKAAAGLRRQYVDDDVLREATASTVLRAIENDRAAR